MAPGGFLPENGCEIFGTHTLPFVVLSRKKYNENWIACLVAMCPNIDILAHLWPLHLLLDVQGAVLTLIVRR